MTIFRDNNRKLKSTFRIELSTINYLLFIKKTFNNNLKELKELKKGKYMKFISLDVAT